VSKQAEQPTGGVDAGLRHMGLAVVYRGRIVDATDVRGEEGLTKVKATERAGRVIEVALRQCHEAAEWFAQFGTLAETALESYEWQGEDKGNLAHAWMVSMQVGMLAAVLPGRIVVQRAVDVLHPTYGYGRILDGWKGRQRGIVPGDEALTNEHKRTAALHAMWCETTSWQRKAAA